MKIAETVLLFSIVLTFPGMGVALLSPKWSAVALIPLCICAAVGIGILLFSVFAFIHDALVDIWR